MKIHNIKKYLILFLCVLAVACTKNNKNNEDETSSQPKKYEITTTYEDFVSLYPPTDYSKNYPDERNMGFGTYCVTNILENDVNIRSLPSLDGKIIHKAQKDDVIWILGFSGGKEKIGNIEGNWLHVIFENNRDIVGWVFSEYVNTNDKEYAPIKFVELIPTESKNISIIKFSYLLNGDEVFIEKHNCHQWKNYYLFIWGQYEQGFHYTNKPGIYLLDKKTLELKHITYLGSFEPWPHVYTEFTDDFEYLIQDSGTSSGVRGIKAWRLKDQEEVFSGGYYGFNVEGHTIDIAYTYGNWEIERGLLDEEILAYGKKFKEENKVPDDVYKSSGGDPFHIGIVIICSYNLTTKERKILKGIYKYNQ